MSNIASYYHLNPAKLRRHYKKHSSSFNQWEQKDHANDYMLFPKNVGPNLSIDEVSLSQGELYTFVTNKEGKGKKGTLVASIKGTLSKDIINVLSKLPLELRETVKEGTLDMAKNMESSIKSCFPKADLVTDRFHVVKLVLDALQHVRIKLRWKEIDKENEAIERCKKKNEKYVAEIFENGDSKKQLLARGRYLLFKKEANWTYNQKERARILFKEYPQLEQAYKHVMKLRNIYEDTNVCSARQRFEHWIKESKEHEIKEFVSSISKCNKKFKMNGN